MSSPVRTAIVADLLEEGWPSMDLVAEMLMAHAGLDGCPVVPILFRPSFGRGRLLLRWRRSAPRARPIAWRIARRFWSYPRWLRHQQGADVYHIVDHTYAHLAHVLPSDRVVITCHDIDAFRSLIEQGPRESFLPRFLARRVLSGLRRAAAVVCVSEATRHDLISHGLVEADRLTVVHNGTHPAFTPNPDPDADREARALTGPPGRADLLHVGSTTPRKRIDILLEVLARVSRRRPDARLWQVGGPLTPAQKRTARDLGIDNRIPVLPFVARPVLAALYRRAALVILPSDREGFGLPVIEAMACGTPVVCTDVPVLREVGGTAAEYCPPGTPAAFASAVLALLDERDSGTAGQMRRAAGLARSSEFAWPAHAAAMGRVYQQVAGVVLD